MTGQHYRVSEIRSYRRQFGINRLAGGGLSGGWYEVWLDRGPPIPQLSVQINLADLRRLRDDLSKEIDRATQLGG